MVSLIHISHLLVKILSIFLEGKLSRRRALQHNQNEREAKLQGKQNVFPGFYCNVRLSYCY